MSHAHVEWLSLRLLHLSQFPSLHSLYLPAHPTAFHLPLPWCRGLQTRALPLRSWVPRTTRTPPQVMSPTTASSRRLMSRSLRSPWPSNGSLKTSTTMTPLSVRRSSTSTEDESITLKEKACRPVCRRRQWVMIERWNPLSTVTKVTCKATDLLGAVHRVHDNWVAYFRTWSRRSCHQSYGRAQTCRNQSNVWNSRKLLHVTLKFETKILRSSQEETEWQEQGAREAAWKLAKNVLKLKEHQRATFFSLRNENLLWTPERPCIWSAKRTWIMLKWIPWRNRAVLRYS